MITVQFTAAQLFLIVLVTFLVGFVVATIICGHYARKDFKALTREPEIFDEYLRVIRTENGNE